MTKILYKIKKKKYIGIKRNEYKRRFFVHNEVLFKKNITLDLNPL